MGTTNNTASELAPQVSYPDNPYDYDAWLAVPPPAQLGAAIHTILRDILALSAEQRDRINSAFEAAQDSDYDAYDEAILRLDEAFNFHPIGAGGCGEVTDLGPWVTAIDQRVGYGPQQVLMAVASRDHELISDADFALLTGWWVNAGQSIPDPITDADWTALIDWWNEL